jgi:hypothetical protein
MAQKLPLVTLVTETSNGDWVGVYIDGVLAYEGHDVSVSRLVRVLEDNDLAEKFALGRVRLKSFLFAERETVEAEQVVVDETGRMPKEMSK